MEENNAGEQVKNSHLLPYQYKKGQSGNPSGRPKGISFKEYLKVKFSTMTEDEREDFLDGIPKLDLLKMAEGNPESKSDITSKGERITPIYAGKSTDLQGHDGNEEDISA